jgi:glycosyltransferase involved in cell wall biosynthesis
VKLSIVIPTFNRNATLCQNLPALLAQINDDVELTILDNASTIPVSYSIKNVLEMYPTKVVNVIRNKANIGAAANILRSFEVASAPWLWILGDDDAVSENAIKDIIKTIQEYPTCVFLNFSTEPMFVQKLRPITFETVGQLGFIEGLDYAGNVNFMSVGLWHVPSIIKTMPAAYHYAYSMSPTFAMLLSILGKDGRCLFSNKAIIQSISNADVSTKWQFTQFILGWNTILELIMQDSARKTLARKMQKWHSPENVLVYFLAEANAKKFGEFYYLVASNRISLYVSRFSQFRFFLYRPLFLYPKYGWALVQFLINIAILLKLKQVDLNDIINRSKN